MKFDFCKKQKSVLGVYALLLAVFALIFLVIPFPKVGASWVVFVFTILAFVGSLGICLYAFREGTELVSKVYGFPVFRIGYLYLAAQLIVCLVISIIGAFVNVPVWIPVIISVVLGALAIVGVIATDNIRDVVEKIDEQVEVTTKQMKYFNIDISNVLDVCEDAEIKKELTKLAENFRYSDPVSSEATEMAENNILDEIRKLKLLVQENKIEEAKEKINKINNLLSERNRICKAFKK